MLEDKTKHKGTCYVGKNLRVDVHVRDRKLVRFGNLSAVPFNYCPECGEEIQLVTRKLTHDEIEDIIEKSSRHMWAGDFAVIKTTSNFIDDLGADQTDLMELVMSLEDKFSIQLDFNKLEFSTITVKSLADLVLQKHGESDVASEST